MLEEVKKNSVYVLSLVSGFPEVGLIHLLQTVPSPHFLSPHLVLPFNKNLRDEIEIKKGA